MSNLSKTYLIGLLAWALSSGSGCRSEDVDEAEVCLGESGGFGEPVGFQLEAGDRLTFVATHLYGCIRAPESSCTVDQDGTTITITTHFEHRPRLSLQCEMALGISEATCSTGPLDAGSYTVRYNGRERTVAVPSVTGGCMEGTTPPVPHCTHTEGTRVDECSPRFDLPALDGSVFRLTEQVGPLVVNVTSVDAAPEPAEFVDGLQTSALHILTHVPTDASAAEAWRAAHGVRGTVVYDELGVFGSTYAGTTQVPTVLGLEADGTVAVRTHEQYATRLADW